MVALASCPFALCALNTDSRLRRTPAPESRPKRRRDVVEDDLLAVEAGETQGDAPGACRIRTRLRKSAEACAGGMARAALDEAGDKRFADVLAWLKRTSSRAVPSEGRDLHAAEWACPPPRAPVVCAGLLFTGPGRRLLRRLQHFWLRSLAVAPTLASVPCSQCLSHSTWTPSEPCSPTYLPKGSAQSSSGELFANTCAQCDHTRGMATLRPLTGTGAWPQEGGGLQSPRRGSPRRRLGAAGRRRGRRRRVQVCRLAGPIAVDHARCLPCW